MPTELRPQRHGEGRATLPMRAALQYCMLLIALLSSAAAVRGEAGPDTDVIMKLLNEGNLDLGADVALELPQEHSQLRIRRIGLHLDGHRIRAAFRDKTRRVPRSRALNVRYLDAYYNEAAAFIVSEVLGLDLVPPTVLREIHIAETGLNPSKTPRQGSLQLWIENAAVLYDLQRDATRYPGSENTKNAQLSEILVFDCIIGNADRHAGNILVDLDPHFPADAGQESQEPLLGKLWAIDHSRAFHKSTRINTADCKLEGLAERPVSTVFMAGLRRWNEADLARALQESGMTERQIDSLHLRALTQRLNKVRSRLEALQASSGRGDESFFSDGIWHRVL